MAKQTSRGRQSASKKRTSRPKRSGRPVSRGVRRTKRKKRGSAFTLKHVFLILAGLAVLVAVGSWGVFRYQSLKAPERRACVKNRREITAVIQGILFRNGLSRQEVQWKSHQGVISFTLKVGKQRLQELYQTFQRELGHAYEGLRIEKVGRTRLRILCRGRVTHWFTFIPPPAALYPSASKGARQPEETLSKAEPPSKEKPKVAIVIDDIGYDLAIARDLMSLPAPVTLSIFPYGPHSKEIAREAKAKGYEVLMHVPMEPEGYPGKGKDPGPGALYVKMLPDDLSRQINEDLDRIPNVSGINNHMGSRFTCCPENMRILMKVLKERKKFFLDSRTSAKSVGYKIAKEEGIPTVKRDVFLDNVRDIKKIREQIERLVEKAKKRGYAVGIGHPHRVTYLALKKAIPDCQKAGIEFVFVSSLAR